jgi:hypothetical protein
VWRGRADLQARFPDPVLGDSGEFLAWLSTQGISEEGLPAIWADPRWALSEPVDRVRKHAASPVIALVGYLDSPLGIGHAARHLLRGLEAAGLDVRPVPTGVDVPSEAPPLDVEPDLTIWAVNPPESVAVMSAMPALLASSAVNVGYWWWEVPWLPPVFGQSSVRLDEIWVGTEFVARCFESLSAPPVHQVPLYLGSELAVSGLSRDDLGWPRDATVYLVRADLNSSLARKNPGAAIDAYLRAFPAADPESSRLVVKVENAHADRSFLDLVQMLGSGRPDVHVMTETLDEPDNNAVSALADVYVSLHRSEGLGLPIAEALALGTAVVATDFGGSGALLTTECAVLVPARVVPVEDPSGTYLGGTWAEPDLAAAAGALRSLADPSLRAAFAGAGRRRYAELGGSDALGTFVRRRMKSCLDPRRSALRFPRSARRRAR